MKKLLLILALMTMSLIACQTPVNQKFVVTNLDYFIRDTITAAGYNVSRNTVTFYKYTDNHLVMSAIYTYGDSPMVILPLK
jgi:hypothetical protein